MEYGYEEGDVCKRKGCAGVIELHPVENCSCHINPPCGPCTTVREHCAECGYEGKHDFVMNDYVVNHKPTEEAYRCWEPRPLDRTKVDWHNRSHTYSSMVKEGVYPDGTDIEEVRKLVNGTFGGRFEHFGGGKFKFIAYTD